MQTPNDQYHHIENDPHHKHLKVNKGVGNVSIINPYRKKTRKRKTLQANDYTQGVLNGDISTLSQAVTLIESSLPEHQNTAQEVIQQCLPYAGNSIRIGITGVPGAGKSTLIETLGMHIIEKGKKIAVLAIDPSSERSKGSILGDKTRMEELSVNEKAFIRPSPSAGSLGGVARKTRETIILCEAAGFDTIIVETVGVGQSEIAVHSMVDFFLLIQLAGTGDELQGIKRGIMEMADGIAINKADGNNVEKAQIARQQFQNAIQLFPKPLSTWKPQVITCSATQKIHIDTLWHMITDYIQLVKKNHYFQSHRTQQTKYWLYETINQTLKNDFYNHPHIKERLAIIEHQIQNKQLSPFATANDLLEYYIKNK